MVLTLKLAAFIAGAVCVGILVIVLMLDNRERSGMYRIVVPSQGINEVVTGRPVQGLGCIYFRRDGQRVTICDKFRIEELSR